MHLPPTYNLDKNCIVAGTAVYSDLVRDHYLNARNPGSPSNPSVKALVKSPVEDTVLITLKISADIIQDSQV